MGSDRYHWDLVGDGDGTPALLAAANVRIAELERELAGLRAAVNEFDETVADAVRANENRGKGGQQVPFHGDFCSAPPSVLNRLEWWARRLKETP